MKSYNHPNNQLAREEQIRQVKSKYASHIQSCIQVTKHEAEGYRDLLHRSTADIVGKYIPAAANDRAGVASMWASEESHLKLTEAAKKYPDFWSGFKTLQNKFTVQSYNKTHEAFANAMRAAKSVSEADHYAKQMQEWHNNLTKGFHLDLNSMLQKFETQLKDVCQPHVCQQHVIVPDNHLPIEVPNENAQHNQLDNETERLMKMLEDMQAQIQRQTDELQNIVNESRQKDGVIIQQNTELTQKDGVIIQQNTELTQKDGVIIQQNNDLIQKDGIISQQTQMNADKQILIGNYAEQVAELRQDKVELRGLNTGLTQKVSEKEVIIDGLNQNIENEHIKYDLLKGQYEALLANNYNPFNESHSLAVSEMISDISIAGNLHQND